MKIALNGRNVILKPYVIEVFDCSQCCFFYNYVLCGNLELRDCTTCRTVKVFDKIELKEIFKL
jgi:hypothetical protein